MSKVRIKKAIVLVYSKVKYETSERRQRAQLSRVFLVNFDYFGDPGF